MNADNREPSVAAMTSEIVSAYVSHHDIAITDLGMLIIEVGQELSGLGREPGPLPAKPEPAVPVRRSVKRDHLICLVCGISFKSLRRHLQSSHGLTPDTYRQLFDLPGDYPMVAAAYSEQRAAIARRTGLGQRRSPEPEVVVQPKTSPRIATKPVRGRRTSKKAEPVPE